MVYPEEYAHHLIGAGGIVLDNNRILLVKLLYGSAKGKWLIPGGFLEKGETLNEGVSREIFEETGVQVEAVGVLGIRSMKRTEIPLTDLYCLLKCKLVSDPNIITKQISEVEDVAWVPLSELSTNNEVHAFTKYLLKSVLDKSTMYLDERHNEFMKTILKLQSYEQYWVS